MNKKTLWLGSLLILGFAILLGLFFSGLGKDPRVLNSVRTGEKLNAFHSRPLPSLFDAQKMIAERDLPPGTFLLNVWGSWCPACHLEHPFLMQLSKEIPIVGVDWQADNPREAEDARAMLQSAGNPYRLVMFDAQGRLVIDLGVYGAPETFLIAPDRTILYRYAGPLDAEIWRTRFAPLIAQEKSHE